MGNVGSMVVALLANTSDFDKKMGASTTKVDKFQKGVQKMGTAIMKAAKLAAAAAAAAVVAFGVSAVKTFVDFDTGMREVFTLMPELSSEAREAMSEDVQALSEEIAVLPNEVIPALYQAISAGVPRENVFSFLEVAGHAAIGGVTSLEVAVDGLTTVTNAYGSEVISVTEVADIMFTAVKEGKTTFDELAARMFQAVPVAAKIGLEFYNVAAAAAQITLSGVPMRVAMTQIRSLLNEVAFEGKELNKVFQEASGMTFPQYMESGGDIAGIIEILQGAADKAGISIAELTANLEAQGALLNLSGVSLGNLKEILDEMANSAGAADKAYEEMADGVKYQIDQLRVWWKLLQLDVGGDLTESLKVLLTWLQENREAIGDGIKAVFAALIDGLTWLQNNSGTVKTALIAVSVGLTAVWAAANPAAAAVLAVIAALAWFDASGGVAGVYDEMQALAQAFRDSTAAERENIVVTDAVVASLVAGMAEATTAVNRYLTNAETGITNYQAAMLDLANAQMTATKSLKDGMRFDDVVIQFQQDMGDILTGYGYTADQIEVLTGDIFQSMLTGWSDATGVVVGSTQEISKSATTTARGIERAKDVVVGAMEEEATKAESTSDRIILAREKASDVIVLASDWEVAAGIAAMQAKVKLAKEEQELRDEWNEKWKGIASDNLSDMLSDIISFHWDAQAAERNHQQRMQDIIEGAADRLAGITQSDQRRREDLQTDHTRKLEDIEEWYWEQVEKGEANTYEKKAALDAARQAKIEDAEKTHKRALEDLDTDYARAVDDNTADRIQAQEDEVAAYKENIPTIGGIVKTGFESMAQSIIDSGIEQAGKDVAGWLWGIATEAKLAADSTNTSLSGIGLPWQASVPLWIASDAGANFVSDANTWLNNLWASIFPKTNTKDVPVNSYGGGGVVPGPIGAPQAAIVHGGEPIGAAGFAEVLDYEKLGQAVTAGFIDAQNELGGGSGSSGGSSDLLTKLAQLLYDPTETERERRGGAA